MEALVLLDLLECPLCMEPLDASAKVLLCQHTFCKQCLVQQEASSPHMCCPECRTPLLGTVEELPTNLLLARLLDTLQKEQLAMTRDASLRYAIPTTRNGSVTGLSENLQPKHKGTEGVLAEALYNYQGNSPIELAMNSGDVARVRWRVDENWNYPDAKESSGLVPTMIVQPLNDQVQPVPLCRALYDFNLSRLDPEDRKKCLAFLKGDIITLIKRVDENWGDGKLRDKAGIFPLYFTEPNPAARRLLGRDTTADSRPRNTRESIRRVGADAGGRRRLSGTLPITARPPNVAPASKRRSGSARRSLPKSERKMNSEAPPTITMALINPQASPPTAESKQSSTQQLSISVCAALYSYSPHRTEELELRKGEMVGVYGKFKEGWLRGLSLRTGKVGILPANYVTPVLRTSARFLEQPKPAIPIANTVSTKRYTPQKPQAAALALDKAKADGSCAPPVVVAPPPTALSSGGMVRAPPPGAKHGWDTVRRAFQPSHRGLPHSGSHQPQNPALTLQPPTQDLGQIYGFGRSPVLPRKRNGLFTNPIRPQLWTYEGTTPSGGGYQTTDGKYSAPKETSVAPQSILVKPDSHRHHTEKPVKSVRFLTEETAQITPKVTSLTSVAQIMRNSSPAALEHWNPSAILGRDGSSSVLKDTKMLQPRKAPAHNHTAPDFHSLSTKTLTGNSQSSPSRHRVVMGYNAQTDAELNLLEGELVLVQKPRADGRVLVTQEITGRTGLFHNSILDILEVL